MMDLLSHFAPHIFALACSGWLSKNGLNIFVGGRKFIKKWYLY